MTNDSPFNEHHEADANDAEHLTLVNGRFFAVLDRNGEITRPGDGALHEDMRVLSTFRLTIDGATDGGDRPGHRQRLAVSLPNAFQAVVVSRPDPSGSGTTPTETYIHRQWAGQGVRHDIEIHNTNSETVERTIRVDVDNDFAHLFDVKSGVGSDRRAVMTWNGSTGRLTHPDDADQRVEIVAFPAAQRTSVSEKSLFWVVRCPANEMASVSISFEPVWDGHCAGLLFPVDGVPAISEPELQLEAWRREAPRVVSDDARLSTTVDRCVADIASLRIFDPIHADRTVVAAGAPWFMTLFGRDSLLTSWMTLPFAPELALGVLRELAELQGSVDQPENEEQPGKIIHELRRRGGNDAFANRGRYYGTVDATPLFVMLAAEANRWGHLTGEDLGELWPNICAATRWITQRLDADPTGFVRYQRSTSTGLVNQGWKDSWDGISFADGRIPGGAIALVEVQGYAYAALRSAAELAEQMGMVDDIDRDLDPVDIERRAEDLKERFDASFWNEKASSYALGLTADGAMIDAVTTNPGHALWSGLASGDRANRYLDRILVDGDLWSGWGLRTLSPANARYNPLSYHNGSVWPHDTALVAAGAARIDRFDAVDRIVDAALDASRAHDGRPPELFSGIARSLVDTPVDYPDSCSPQAWSSASTLLNLRSSLGLEPPEELGKSPRLLRADLPGIDFELIEGIRCGELRMAARRMPEGVVLERPAERG